MFGDIADTCILGMKVPVGDRWSNVPPGRWHQQDGYAVLEWEGWCGRRDLNPHGFRRHPLKMVCLPIPPLPQIPMMGRGLFPFRAWTEVAPDWAVEKARPDSALVALESSPPKLASPVLQGQSPLA